MKPFHIDAEWLREHGACVDAVDKFCHSYPAGADVTADNLRLAKAAGHDVNWLRGRLPYRMQNALHELRVETCQKYDADMQSVHDQEERTAADFLATRNSRYMQALELYLAAVQKRHSKSAARRAAVALRSSCAEAQQQYSNALNGCALRREASGQACRAQFDSTLCAHIAAAYDTVRRTTLCRVRAGSSSSTICAPRLGTGPPTKDSAATKPRQFFQTRTPGDRR